LWDGAQVAILGDFFGSCICSEQHLSDLHSKFALGPHHVSMYGRHPTAAAEIRRGKKRRQKIEDRKKLQGKNIMVCLIT